MEENLPLQKKKRAATKTEIGRELQAIYGNNEDGAPADLKTFERAKRKRRWPMILAITLGLFILAGIAWAGIIRFGGSLRYSDNVTLAIDGPVAPRAGDLSTWTINYENNDNLPLAQASLTLNLPPSVTFVSSDPTLPDATSLVWQVGAVEAGGKGAITVRGRILDAVNAPVAVRATLSYRPANFNADFQKVANWSSQIADAAVTADLSGPSEAVPGDSQTFTLTVARRADLAPGAVVPDLRINFDPDQFIVVKSAQPAFSTNDDRSWSAAAPTVATPLTFTVTGSFATNTTGVQNVRANVGTLDNAGNLIVLATAVTAVNVLPGDLVLTLLRNGSNTDSTVALGGAMHLSVDYENKSTKTIGNATVALTIAGTPSSNGKNPVDWSTLNDLHNGKRSGNTVTWTKNEISDLGSVAPGAKGEIDLDFKTTANVFTTDDRNYDIDLSAIGTIGTMDGKTSGKTVSTPVMRTLVSSDAAVTAATDLADGSAPLKVGQTSTYRVVWVITNSLHVINGIKVTATLPPNVSFVAADKANNNVGDILPPDPSGNIIWAVPSIPTSFKSVSAAFTVSLTPTASDVKKTMPVLGQTTLSATDGATNGALADTSLPLTTGSDASQTQNTDGTVSP